MCFQRIRSWICLLLMLTAFSARADIPAAFVDIGYGARPVGMGGAYVALASDPYAMFWNPAGLPYVKGYQTTMMYAKQYNLIPYTLASGATTIHKVHGVGLAFLSSGDDVLRETAIMAGYGARLVALHPSLKNVSVGLTFKYRMSSFGNNREGGEGQISGSASGYGVDLGLRYKFAPKWTVGVLYRDAINGITYNNETRDVSYSESVPPALIFGTAFLARSNLVFVLDWDKSLQEELDDRISAGAELRLFKILFARGGWSQRLGIEPNRKWNWGLGLQYFTKGFGVRFDFAYQIDYLASTPRISTSLWF